MMKSLLLALIAAFAGTCAYAQQLDHPITVPLTFYSTATATSQTASFSVSVSSGVSSGNGGTNTPPFSYTGNTTTAPLIPGKDYTVTVTSSGCGVVVAHFEPTQNERVFINNVLQNNYANGTNYTFILRLEYANDPTSDLPGGDSLAGKPAGAYTVFPEDKPIFYIGLGTLRDGRFAGALGFRAQGITNDLSTPAALIFNSIDQATWPVSKDANGYITKVTSDQMVFVVDPYTGSGQTKYSITGYAPADTALATPIVKFTVSQCTIAAVNGIRVDRAEDGGNWATALTYNPTSGQWTRYNWQSLGATSNAFDSNSAVTTSVSGSTETVNYGTGSGSTTKSKTFSGAELASTTWGSGLPTAPSTSYQYYADASGAGWPSALKSEVTQGGNWTAYDYYSTTSTSGAAGMLNHVYKPWLDGPSTPSFSGNSGYIETYSYTTSYDSSTTAISQKSVAINGTPVGNTTWTYNWSSGSANGHAYALTAETNYTGPSTYTSTTTRSFLPSDSDPWLQGKPYSVTYPNGRKDSYAYFKGTWNASTATFTSDTTGSDRMVLVFHGQASGGTALSSWTNGSTTWTLDTVSMYTTTDTSTNPATTNAYSTVSMTVSNVEGLLVFTGENAYNGSSIELLSGSKFTYDTHHRVLSETDAIRGTSTSHSYLLTPSDANTPIVTGLSYVEEVTDAVGVKSVYEYDQFLRPALTYTGANPTNAAYPAKTQQTVFGPASLPMQTYTCSCQTSPIAFEYDSAGRVLHRYEKSPNDPNDNSNGSLVTSYSYDTFTATTTTLPTGATRTDDYFIDGHQKSVIGTSAPTQYWSYSVNSTGIEVTTGYVQDNNHIAQLTYGGSVTQYDYVGRVAKQSSPAYKYSSAASNNVVDVAYNYDDVGVSGAGGTGNLLSKHTTYRAAPGTPLIPDQLFSYDNGRLIAQGLDVNNDGVLTDASNDRITYVNHRFTKISSTWYDQTDTSSPATLNSATAARVSSSKTQMTGLSGSSAALVVSVDSSGRTTTQTTSFDSSNKRVTTQITTTGLGTAYASTDNGYDSFVQSFTGEIGQRTYDSRGRLSQVLSRGVGTYLGSVTFGATADTYNYYNGTSYLLNSTIGGVYHSFLYSWGTDGTRTKATTDQYGNTAYTKYNAMDLPWHVGEAAASAMEIGYDAYGRRTSITTYADGTHTETDWPATGSTTTWVLDFATGLPTAKQFSDYTAANNHQTTYDYTVLGQPKTRTWGRKVNGNPLTTTYTYFDGTGSATATDVSYRTRELQSVTYSDGTTPVSFTYKRTGVVASVTDITGTRTFGFQSTNPFLLNTESFDSTFYASRVLTRVYSSGTDIGFTEGTELQQSAVPNAAGLVDHVTAIGGTVSGTFTYGYKPSSGLVDNYTSGSFKAAYDYDGTTAARRTRVEGSWTGTNTATFTRFDLGYDARGFVQYAKQSGTAFNDYYSGTSYTSTYNWYAYDPRGQLQTSIMYRGSPPTSGVPSSADQLPGLRFEYRYDGVGNRLSSGATGAVNTGDNGYSGNSVNQYSAKDNVNISVLGTVLSGSSLTATSTGTTGGTIGITQLDRSFAAAVAPNNTSGPAMGTLTVSATNGGSSANQSRNWMVPALHQSLQYDEDGNLTNDGMWSYTYDAENRVTQMTSVLPSGYTRLQLNFKYDYLNRRVEKRVTNIDTSTTTFFRRFLYDGWNLVGELDGTGTTLQRTFAWGLDIADSRGATGGVGALLAIVDLTGSSPKTYYPTYDGNGDVASLVEASSGAIAATYEYSPFGELLRREEPAGGYAKANPFRFSTKYTDEETGLVYYGMRYYSPGMGRFINRDPIEEQGGANLYAFVANNPVNAVDFLGLTNPSTDHYSVNCHRTVLAYKVLTNGCVVQLWGSWCDNDPTLVTWTTMDCSGSSAVSFHPGGSGNSAGSSGSSGNGATTSGTNDGAQSWSAPNKEAERKKQCEELHKLLAENNDMIAAQRNHRDRLQNIRNDMAGFFDSTNPTFAGSVGDAFGDIAEFGFDAFVPEGPAKLFGTFAFRTKGLVDAGRGSGYDKVSGFANATLGLTTTTLTYGEVAVGSKVLGRAGPWAGVGVLSIKLAENLSPYFIQNAQSSSVLESYDRAIADNNFAINVGTNRMAAWGQSWSALGCGDFYK